MFDEKFDWKDSPQPWGLYIPEKYLKKFYKHKHMTYKLVNIRNGKAIDVSAGSGRFSWDLIDMFSLFVFCDISVDSAIFLTERAIREGKKNVVIVRYDYFSPPFNEEVFDLSLCQDTLIYGYEHEMILLSTIYKILSKNGVAIVDFSNKYHRSFWHKPYTYAYSKQQMIKMLKTVGFNIDMCIPLYHELTFDIEERTLFSKLLKFILPPTRYIFRVRK